MRFKALRRSRLGVSIFLAIMALGAFAFDLRPAFAARTGEAECYRALRVSKASLQKGIIEKAIEKARRETAGLLEVPYSLTWGKLVAGSVKSKFWIYASTEHTTVHEKAGYLMEFDSNGNLLNRFPTFNYDIPLNPTRGRPRIQDATELDIQFLAWDLASSAYLLNEGASLSKHLLPVGVVPVDAFTKDPNALFSQLDQGSNPLNLANFEIERSRNGMHVSLTVGRTSKKKSSTNQMEMLVRFERHNGVMIVSEITIKPSLEPRLIQHRPMDRTRKEFDQFMENVLNTAILSIKSYSGKQPDGTPGDPLARVYIRNVRTKKPGVRTFDLMGYDTSRADKMIRLGQIEIAYRTDEDRSPTYPATLISIIFARSSNEERE